MNICIITGSSGLIGSESVTFFAQKFDKIIGIDNNMRQAVKRAKNSRLQRWDGLDDVLDKVEELPCTQ
jgi:CDP-paratose 2-epimerase